MLDARQLGLKYIANVTYGYTSATFSGRMPAVEIADSIVQSGRETLEKVRGRHGTSMLLLNHAGYCRQSS
jgi:DNA polymerase zeta